MIFQKVPELINSTKIRDNLREQFSKMWKNFQDKLTNQDYNDHGNFHDNSLMLAKDYSEYVFQSHQANEPPQS